ncbi:Slo-interacting protein 1 [Aphelenchoides bicaudatus]|nr:Slo-interacting protein 1 [Aphelenchoides bicaudatus]
MRIFNFYAGLDLLEVELKRSASCQRLGLTLCYGGNEGDTEIYVSRIEPGSIADRCKRMFVGDQILQINNINVKSRQEAIQHFANESERIVLLLARPSVEQDDDEENYEEEHVIFEEHLTNGTALNIEKPLGTLAEHEDSTTENSQTHEKDSGLSGLSRTDSEPEQQQRQRMEQANEQKSRSSMEQSFENELTRLHAEMENIRLECARLMNQRNTSTPKSNQQPQQTSTTPQTQAQQALSLMNMIEKLSTSVHQSSGKALSNISNSTKTTVIERQSRGTETPPPPAHQQQNPQSSFGSNFLQTPKMSRKPTANLQSQQQTPRMLHRQKKIYDETTSSAYNTGGDSCRSTPNNQHLQFMPPPRRPIHLTVAQKHIDVSNFSTATTSENPYHTIETPVANTPIANQFRLPRFNVQPPQPPLQIPPVQPDNRTNSKNFPAQRFVQPVPQISFQPGDTMYTTADKLAETIALQQRLLRQAVNEPTIYSNQKSSSLYAPQNEYHTIRTNDSQKNSTYEWKVKRRADGSRYITRRPIRSQILKAREEQLNRERTGLSTDDDAASELKTGKFWSRQERKEHIQRQREKKLKKHQFLMQKQKHGHPDQLIQTLSHRKQIRHSGQQFFDKFTTIQEFLAHGARDPSLRPAGGILERHHCLSNYKFKTQHHISFLLFCT